MPTASTWDLTSGGPAAPADLVVLATGMQPVAPAGLKSAGAELDEYGFLVAGADGGAGISSAGVASAPLDVSMSVQSATAAALKAFQAVRGV